MSEQGIPYNGDGWWAHTVKEAKDCILKQQERIAELEAENAKLKAVIQMCFDDSCSPCGPFLKKKTVLEVMKYADRSV